MRRYQKRQIEDFIHLLDEAHVSIRKALRAGERNSVLQLLAQCQEGAVSLGGLLESLEGEGLSTVACLEEYCEEVYQCYEAVHCGNAAMSGSRVCKRLSKALAAVQKCGAQELRVQKEVLFLPYKASMWDSLESIWKAAEADSECCAYVVPIPYYDRNPDGSFGQRHYEGGMFPEDVPVISYQTYNLVERRPDIVFIHNPYDNANFVTSVDPEYYTDHLKSYTDLLVYVPYFVMGEISPDDDEAIEKNVKHFCTVPGVLNADRVIVQSENMRKIYINVLTKVWRNQPYWEEKILGVGSPKYDKVFTTERTQLEIPEDWRRRIEKPDGTWKRIVFYNTSVAALLEGEEDMLEKIQWVLQIFEKRQNEIALLWRPHPLIEATIASMRPRLWEKYRRMVERYRREGWGIYDDSADMNRAIALSDAYYGDGSSVMHLYQKTGKPVLIQTVERARKANTDE